MDNNPALENTPKLNEPSLEKADMSVAPSDSLAVDNLLDAVLADHSSDDAKPETKTEPVPQPTVPQPTVPETPVEPAKEPAVAPDNTITTPEPVQPEVPKTEESDEEVAKIQMPKNMNPAKATQWKDLQNLAVERGKKLKSLEPQLATLQKELEETKQKAANPQIPEDLQKYVQELEDFRSAHDMLNDKEFVDKYFKPMSDLENSVMDFLKSQGMTDENVAIMKKNGILGTSEEAWKTILTTLDESNPIAKERLGKLLADFYNLNDQQQKALQDAPNRVKEYRETKIKEAKTKRKAFENTINTEIDRVRKVFPQANRKEIPNGATPDQIAQITAHNKMAEKVEKDFVSTFQALQTGDPKTLVETVAAALMSVAQTAEIDKLNAVIKERDLRIEQLTNSVSKQRAVETPPKSTVTNQKPNAPRTVSDQLKLKNEDAIESALASLGY